MIENIEAVERRLWTAADQLRANSDFASNEYFMPVMGLIFLRHAYSRYLAVSPKSKRACPAVAECARRSCQTKSHHLRMCAIGSLKRTAMQRAAATRPGLPRVAP